MSSPARSLLIVSLLAAWILEGCDKVHRIEYPPARRVESPESLHGIAVRDQYRWMENLDAEEVLTWARAQDRIAREYSTTEERRALRDAIADIARVERYGVPLRQGDRYFYLRFPATGPGPGTSLLMRKGEDDPASVLIDPSDLPADAGLTRAVPDPTGRRVAYLVTRGGSGWTTVRIREVDTGRDLPDVLTGVHAGLSTIAWSPDGAGVYYERFDVPPAGTERTALVTGERIAFHAIGSSQERDQTMFERPDHPDWSLTHSVTSDGRWLVIVATDGATQHSRVYYRDLTRPERRVAELIPGGDAAYRFVGNRRDTFRFWTDLDAPRGRVVAVNLESPDRASWRVLVGEAEQAISSWIGATAIGDRIVIGYLEDARTVVKVFDEAGRSLYDLRLPREGSIWSGFSGTQLDPIAFYSLSDLVDPGTVYRLDIRTGESRVFQAPVLGYRPDDFVTRQVFTTSRDGTRVPMFLVHARNVDAGRTRPVFMYGYGFGAWTAAPWFQPHMTVWLQRGGAWALPNLRGGGEYGEEWHQSGSRLVKQNAIDDYLSAAEWLIANRWTTAKLLVANGSSAGGAVVGAALVQRPDLFGAGVLDYPVLDMLRYDRFTGAHRWRSEYGTSDDPSAFRALLAYSPLHNVAEGICYPPILVSPGERDEVTPPFHAYKFVAALQHADACGGPALLRVTWRAGHSAGATLDDSIETWADQLAFLERARRE